MTLRERIWSRITPAGEDECWSWSGNTDKDGYPQITVRYGKQRRRNFRVHRYLLEENLGRSLYPGFGALHACDRPGCVNPAHLFEGTSQENVADKVRKNRQARNPKTDIRWQHAQRPELQVRGESHPRARLTSEQVGEIIRLRREEDWTQVKLASHFQVSRRAIRAILDGKNWKHLDFDPPELEAGQEC